MKTTPTPHRPHRPHRPYRRPLLAAAFLCLAGSITSSANDGYQWHAMTSGTTNALHQISVVDNDFAVASGTNGKLLVFSDGAWSALPGWDAYAPAIAMSNTLYVTALSKTNIWMGTFGAHNQLFQWDGTNFTSRSAPGTYRTRFLANVDGLLLAARGENRISYSLNPSAPTPALSTVAVPHTVANQVISAVAGSGDDNLFAMSAREAFRSTNAGATWTNIGRPSGIADSGGETLTALSVSSSGTAWYGTSEGRILSWASGTATFDEAFNLGFNINSIYARDDEHIWIAGTGGNLWFYNGTDTSKIDLGTTQSLLSITGNSDGVWVVGGGGVIFSTIPEPSIASVAVLGLGCIALAKLLGKGRN